MIVKVIDPPKPENDHYRRLARYIADADHAGEKALVSWCAGCWAGKITIWPSKKWKPPRT